jgi:hypothetical protein
MNNITKPKAPLMSDLPWVECECGNNTFDSKMMFKKCSAILSPSGKEEHVPVEIVVCTKCGKFQSLLLKI